MDLSLIVDYTDEAALRIAQLRDPNGALDDVDCYEMDPVYMPTGNFLWDYTDIAVHEARPLEFRRYYNAQDRRDGELDFGWCHSYMYSLEATMLFATVTLPDGVRLSFNIRCGGEYVSAEGIPYTLESHGGGHELTDLGMTKHFFDGDGRITAIEDTRGNRTEIARSGAAIQSISSSSGTLTFSNVGGRITRIADQTGRSVSYNYNPSGDLASFQNADGDTLGYT